MQKKRRYTLLTCERVLWVETEHLKVEVYESACVLLQLFERLKFYKAVGVFRKVCQP